MENENEVVSVLIPMYNASNTIEECINSILNQTYENIELILSDDGSTDDTLEICRKYLIDSRVILLKNKHGGVSKTRNSALDVASGNWIMFVDSDDWIEKNCVATVMKKIEKYKKADAVVFNLQNEFRNGYIKQELPIIEKELYFETSMHKQTLIETMLTEKTETGDAFSCFTGPCCKILRKETIGSLRFLPTLALGEDLKFCMEFFSKATGIVYISDIFYHRRVMENSLSNGFKLDYCQRRQNLIDEIAKILPNDIYKRAFGAFCLNSYIFVIYNYFSDDNNLSYSQAAKYTKRFWKKNHSLFDYSYLIKSKQKWKLICKYNLYWVFYMFKKIKRRKKYEKKILLVTLQGDNIGNRLQNYALQEIIKKLGYEVSNPYYDLPEYNSFMKRIKNRIKIVLGTIGIKKYRNEAIRNKRIKKYYDFNKTYINNMFKLDFKKVFNMDWSGYHYAVTGSDQVWHGWSDDDYELPYFYLEFMPIEKRIAYAPSFGFDEIPLGKKDVHYRGLSNINDLSIREKKGSEIVKKLIERDAKLVLDPTLLLEKQDWQVISKPSPLYRGKDYILIYFLGNKDKKYLDSINELKKENNLDVIDVLDKNNMLSMLTTPDEFVWLVEHASYVCTDSFHATVFSILYHKQFLSFRRREIGMEKMFDRIETVLELFGIKDRVYESSIAKIDDIYTLLDISVARKDSLDYLKSSLK